MENFRCYAPKETVPLETRPNKPLLTFVGENSAGKTSIFLAVLWVLYGEKAILRYAESRPQDKQAPHNNFDLINSEVVASSPRPFMRVSLVFEHEGIPHYLFRTVSSKNAGPRSERDLQPEAISLRIGKSATDEHDPQGKIDDILPFDAFQFFFFDGEDVRRYSGATSNLTREAIEQVLGIPEIRDALDDFERIQRRLLQRMSQEEGIDETIKTITQALDTTIEELRRFSSTRDSKKKELAGVIGELATNEARRERLKGIAEFNAQLIDLKKESETTEHNLEEAILDRDQLVKDLPYSLIKPDLRRTLERLKRSVGADDLTQQIGVVRAKLTVLDELVSPKSKSCYCGTAIHQEHRRQFTVLKKTFAKELGELETLASKKTIPPIEDVDYVLGRIEGTNVDFKAHEKKITEFKADLIEYDDKIRAIESKIKGSNIEEAVKVQELIEKLREQKGSLTKEIENLDTLITEREERKERQEGMLRRQQYSKGVMSGIPARRELCGKVANSFGWIVEELIRRKRENIIKSASEFFKGVTDGGEWSGIKIDDDYSVWLVDSTGRQILPGEGYKEMVALSFIYGLNKAATYNAPVMMDFVLGRLDSKHQLGVAENLSDFSDQILAFFLDTEIQLDDVRTELHSLETSHFTIQRNAKTGLSTIRETRK